MARQLSHDGRNAHATPPSMLDTLRQSLAMLTPAERRIAEAILDTPSTAITWSVADTARIAKVSEPSVIRFCRRLNYDGFPDFRLKLAQHLATLQRTAEPAARAHGDPAANIVDGVFDRAVRSIGEARLDIDLPSLQRAVDLLAGARRIDIYGYGGSGFLAAEAQHRMAGLGLASVAYADPTLQMVSAPHLTSRDVLFTLSFSGLTSYLISNIEIARKAGAKIVSISPAGSLVAGLSDVNIALNAYRNSKRDFFIPTGRVAMYVLLNATFALLTSRLERDIGKSGSSS